MPTVRDFLRWTRGERREAFWERGSGIPYRRGMRLGALGECSILSGGEISGGMRLGALGERGGAPRKHPMWTVKGDMIDDLKEFNRKSEAFGFGSILSGGEISDGKAVVKAANGTVTIKTLGTRTIEP